MVSRMDLGGMGEMGNGGRLIQHRRCSLAPFVAAPVFAARRRPFPVESPSQANDQRSASPRTATTTKKADRTATTTTMRRGRKERAASAYTHAHSRSGEREDGVSLGVLLCANPDLDSPAAPKLLAFSNTPPCPPSPISGVTTPSSQKTSPRPASSSSARGVGGSVPGLDPLALSLS